MTTGRDYRSLQILKVNNDVVTPIIKRPKAHSKCIQCQKDVSPHQGDFENAQRKKKNSIKNKSGSKKRRVAVEEEDGEGTSEKNGVNADLNVDEDILFDELIECEGDGCPYKMHLSCLTYMAPIAHYNAQYLCLEKNTGKILCPDHFCATCFTHGRQQTAFRGNLIKSKNFLLSFHNDECLPVGGEIEGVQKRRRVTLPILRKFEGERLPICYGCGHLNAKLKEDNTLEELEECETCIHSYHPSCLTTKMDGSDGKQCEDCLSRTQIRKSDKILVIKNGIPCAAEICSWSRKEPSKKSEMQIMIKFINQEDESGDENQDEEEKKKGETTKEAEPVWISPNQMFRAYRELAPALSHSLRDHYCFLGRCQSDAKELNLASAHLKNFFESGPLVPRMDPTFRNTYVIHESIRKLLPRGFVAPIPLANHGLVQILSSDEKGFHGKANRDIKKGEDILDYTGEIIDDKENQRREALGSLSVDGECKYYSFQTIYEFESGKTVKVFIDAAVHHNETSMLNSDCDPNCRVTRVPIENGSGLSVLRVRAIKDIKKDEEMTIKYGMKGLDCWCTTCIAKREPLEWNVQHGAEKCDEYQGNYY